MSTDLPNRPEPSLDGVLSFALVVSKYNSEFTGAMAEHATRELNEIVPGARIVRIEVPGAFEVPLMVQLLAQRGSFSAVLALGVIIRGATAHADLIAASITDALMQISLANRIPVIHEVLLVADADQARARCMDGDLNRGIEAARAAVMSARAVQSITST